MKQKKRVPKRRFKGFTDEWKERTMGDLGWFGKTYSYSRANEGVGDYYHIHYGDIHSRFNGIIKKNTKIPSIKVDGNYELLNNGDIVIADASEDYKDLGKTVVIEEVYKRKIISGLHTFKFTPNKYLNSTFYLYYSQSNLFKKFTYKTGTGISVFGISKENISKMMLNIPSFPEQQKIGHFFKQLDDMISLQQRKLEKAKSLKSAYLTEMFPAEGEQVPKRRFAGFTDEWEKRSLGELAESFEYGLNAPAIDYDGVNKYIRITDIDDDTRLFNQNGLTSPETDFLKANNYLLQKGDVLFARTGASVGKTYRYQDSDGKVYYAGFLIRAKIKQEFNSEFIFQNTLTPKYDNFIRVTSQRSGQPGVNAQEYAVFQLMVPSKDEQDKIGHFFESLDRSIAIHQRKLDKLEAMKQAYLYEMFV